MIVKEKVSWLRLLFQIRGSSFTETWPRIFGVTVVAMIVTYVELYYSIQKYTLTTTPFALIGVAIGVFLGFRNNAAILADPHLHLRAVLGVVAAEGADHPPGNVG